MPETTPQVERLPVEGGSHLRMPDGTVTRVTGTDLTEEEQLAGAKLLEAHDQVQLAAARAEELAPAAKSESTGSSSRRFGRSTSPAAPETPQGDAPAASEK